MAQKITPRKPSQAMIEMLRATASNDEAVSLRAARMVAKAMQMPLRQGILKGDNHSGIFERKYFAPGTQPSWPIDFLSPSNADDFAAYTVPSIGRTPERAVEGDEITMPLIEYTNSIDTHLKYIRDANWDVVGRMMQVLEAGHVLKKNKDAWHTLIIAAINRGLVYFDGQASAGLLTKRLISLMITGMRRSGGGNANSIDQFNLTDVYMSPELFQDMRSWDLSQIDDITRREIFLAGGGPTGETPLARIFGVNLHLMDELGEGQEYQTYYTNNGGTLPGSKLEVVVGLDLTPRSAFLMPWREEIQVNEDKQFFRQRRFGFWSLEELGWGALENRAICLGAA